MAGPVVRSLVFHLDGLDPRLLVAMASFRLATNRAIRFALERDARSRGRFNGEGGYRTLARMHRDLHSHHILGAIEVALGVLKAHRRRVRQGGKATTPFVKRLFLKTTAQAYRVDPNRNILAVPIRAGEWIRIPVPVSDWHRAMLTDPKWKQGSLTLLPDRAIVTLTRAAPTPYEPEAIIALDTNLESLDGVIARSAAARLVTIAFPDVPVLQARYQRRRQRLARKKARDRRVQRKLLAREGRRERNRVRQRLHRITKGLVQAALEHRAVIVLEDLTGLRRFDRGRDGNRVLSAWPRREIHRQLAYKALAAGVPTLNVNPAYTSKTCPACGERQRRDRAGPAGRRAAAGQDAPVSASRRMFKCGKCDWRLDRQHNAGVNILQTARAAKPALARGLRFDPGTLSRDVMTLLYDRGPTGPKRTSQTEESGVSVGRRGPTAAQSRG